MTIAAMKDYFSHRELGVQGAVGEYAILVPLAYPFMVPLGLHWPLNAVMLLNIQQLGFDYIQGPMGAWNFACFGATAGVLYLAWRDRDVQMRQTATGALAAGLLGGISEPSLYGIHLRFKKIYPRMLVGCLVGGVIIGLLGGVQTSAFAFTSLLTIPVFSPVFVYIIAITAAFFTSMILVVVLDYRTPEQKAAGRADLEAKAPEQVVVVVGDAEAQQAKQWLAALGGADNVRSADLVAGTRIRVTVGDSGRVDTAALADAGLPGAVQVSDGVWHLVAGPTADQSATTMKQILASRPAGEPVGATA